VDHGWYRLDEMEPATRANVAERPSGRTVGSRDPTYRTRAGSGRPAAFRVDIDARVSRLIGNFDSYLEHYAATVPFVRAGQLELHQQTIRRRRELGSAWAAVLDARFTALPYQTLQAWGIGRRLSVLTPLGEFRPALGRHAEQ
jgi:hypothetical protein